MTPSLAGPRPVVLILMLATCLAAGAASVIFPALGWIALGSLVGILLLQAPPLVWVGAAVTASVISRAIVAAGLAPQVVNFFHFPLAIGAALTAGMDRGVRSPLRRDIAVSLIGLLALSLASWAAGGGQLVRPLLTWLVFGEPFLILYALAKTPVSARQAQFLWRVALSLTVIQLPLAVRQAVSLGLTDPVQGTFINMGAGAHVAGGVALLGTIICLCRAMASRRVSHLIAWSVLGILLTAVPVLGDAKQAFAAFVVGSVMILRVAGPHQWVKKPVLAGLSVLLIGWVLMNAFAFHMIVDLPLIRAGVEGKTESYALIARTSSPAGWILGLGPGNSVSRVALMGLESYIKVDSPVRVLGLVPAPTTQEILSLTRSRWLFSSSSAWSGISSWLGLWGDLGLVGVFIYLWAARAVWSTLRRCPRWECATGSSALIMAALLGAIYSWLEEPGFMLLVALVAGLGVVAAREERTLR